MKEATGHQGQGAAAQGACQEESHGAAVGRQFGEQAEAYLHSAVHAQGEEFARLRGIVSGHAGCELLDLGCGAGHVAFQVAPVAGKVVAFDLSGQMLSAVAQGAQARGISNIETAKGEAESLPFANGRFDFVMSRYSAHHWRNFGKGLQEARRVLKPGGKAAFIDVAAPGDALLDTFLQTVEILRDKSHVRDYSAAQWLMALEAAGFAATALARQRLRLEFSSWLARMRTPAVFEAAILALQKEACKEVRDYFEIAEDGSFTVDVLVWEAEGR
jgi:ubiquinone/menaquinone biosynthesis C-methylase UbiE